MRDIDEILPPLAFPIRGKIYTSRPIGARTGMRMQTIGTDHPDPEIAALTGEDFSRFMLGPCYDEMLDDDVPYAYISRALLAAIAEYRHGRAEAERVWEAGLDPETVAALMAAANQATLTTSTSTASVKKTRSPARIRSTPSRSTSSKPTPAKTSAGRRSSTNGRT